MIHRASAKAVCVPLTAAAWAVLALAVAAPAHAEDKGGHEHHHHAEPAKPGYQRSLHAYTLPSVTLVREDGRKVAFPADMDDGRPVLLNFIYTTCTAICPVLSQTFSAFQKKLGAEAEKVRMVSVSVDPDEDTPERLAEYARRYQAGPQWTHYTGSLEASISVQKAFGAYFVDKMNHRPVVFLRAAPGHPWLRLDGFTTPDDLVREYRGLGKTG